MLDNNKLLLTILASVKLCAALPRYSSHSNSNNFNNEPSYEDLDFHFGQGGSSSSFSQLGHPINDITYDNFSFNSDPSSPHPSDYSPNNFGPPPPPPNEYDYNYNFGPPSDYNYNSFGPPPPPPLPPNEYNYNNFGPPPNSYDYNYNNFGPPLPGDFNSFGPPPGDYNYNNFGPPPPPPFGNYDYNSFGPPPPPMHGPYFPPPMPMPPQIIIVQQAEEPKKGTLGLIPAIFKLIF